MFAKARLYISAILLSATAAGCTPAHFVQRAQPVQACEVRVCTNFGGDVARCGCRSAEQVQRQLREAGFLELQ